MGCYIPIGPAVAEARGMALVCTSITATGVNDRYVNIRVAAKSGAGRRGTSACYVMWLPEGHESDFFPGRPAQGDNTDTDHGEGRGKTLALMLCQSVHKKDHEIKNIGIKED